jgi:hypothetical protein
VTDQWYFAKIQPRRGPFSAAHLRELAATGQIRPQDTVWKEGIEPGVLAAKVKHLFETLSEPAPVIVSQGPTAAERPSTPAAESLPPEAGDFNLDDLELAPGEPTPWKPAADQTPAQPEEEEDADSAAEKPPPRPPETKKTKRVVGVKGGVVISQDGVMVKFRNKCQRCSYADVNVASMPIRSGVTRVNIFCPKCKKNQQVEVQAVG